MRIKADLLCQDTIGTRTNFNLPFEGVGLSFLVKSHHDRCSSQFFNQTGMLDKFLLSLFQRYGIYDRFTLQTLQPGFYHLPLRRINHHRNTCNIGFGHHQIQKNSHFFLGIQQPIIHININNQCTVFYLLTCNAQCLFVFLFVYQTKKLTRTRHIATFAHIDKINFGCLFKQLQSRKPHPLRLTCRNVRACLLHQWNIFGNIFFSRATTSADNIHQTLVYVFLHFRSHISGSLVILPQAIRESCIGIRTDIIRSTRSQPFQKRFQLFGSERAIQADRKNRSMLNRRKKGIQSLTGKRAAGNIRYRHREHQRHFSSHHLHCRLSRKNSSLGIQCIKYSLYQESIHSPFQQCFHLLPVGTDQLIISKCTHCRIIHIGTH